MVGACRLFEFPNCQNPDPDGRAERAGAESKGIRPRATRQPSGEGAVETGTNITGGFGGLGYLDCGQIGCQTGLIKEDSRLGVWAVWSGWIQRVQVSDVSTFRGVVQVSAQPGQVSRLQTNSKDQ